MHLVDRLYIELDMEPGMRSLYHALKQLCSKRRAHSLRHRVLAFAYLFRPSRCDIHSLVSLINLADRRSAVKWAVSLQAPSRLRWGRARDLESLGVGVVIVSGARCGLDMSTSFQLTTSTENLRKEVVNEELSIK